MAMTMQGSRSGMADINVTPMIDILLVLLIIFMVIVPQMPNGLAAAVPQPANPSTVPAHRDSAIVVQVLSRASGRSPAYQINGTPVAYSDLLPRLTAIYANRAPRVMFVKGDGSVGFQYIAGVIDLGRAANVDRVGLLTPASQLAP